MKRMQSQLDRDPTEKLLVSACQRNCPGEKIASCLVGRIIPEKDVNVFITEVPLQSPVLGREEWRTKFDWWYLADGHSSVNSFSK